MPYSNFRQFLMACFSIPIPKTNTFGFHDFNTNTNTNTFGLHNFNTNTNTNTFIFGKSIPIPIPIPESIEIPIPIPILLHISVLDPLFGQDFAPLLVQNGKKWKIIERVKKVRKKLI